MPEGEQGRTSEAIHAIARLLASAVEAGEPDVVRRTLTREARAFFDVSAAALIAIRTDGRDRHRRARVIAAEPPLGIRPAADLAALGPLADLVDHRVSAVTLDRDGARDVAHTLGLRAPDDASLLLLPVRTGAAIAHVLAFVIPPARLLTDAELDVAGAYADAASAALEQLRLSEDRAQLQARELALSRAATALKESHDLHEALGEICDEAIAVLDADNAAVFLGSAEEGTTLEVAHGFPPEAIGHALEPGSGLAGQAIAADRSMLTNEYQRIAGPPGDFPFPHLVSALAVPLRWDGIVHGVVSVGYTRPFAVTGEHLTLLESFAELAGTAARNASDMAGLTQAAHTDGLTGCLNHAALQKALRREIERSERSGRPLSLVLIDLDEFKQVNDEYGHLRGDEVLRDVGAALRHATRPYDLVARYGGDEFAIVAVDTDESAALDVARRAIDRLSAALHDEGEEGPPRPGATAGVAEWRPSMSVADLVDRADRALMSGKQGGRRGVPIRASEMPPEMHIERLPRPGEDVATVAPPGHSPSAAGPPPETEDDGLRRRSRRLALAGALGARLVSMTDADAILDATVDELHRAFGFHLCEAIRIEGDELVSVAARGTPVDEDLAWGWRAPRDAGVIGRCLREVRVVRVDDVTSDPDYFDSPITTDVRSELVAPLHVGDDLLGAINIEETMPGAFDDEDVEIVGTVAEQVAAALLGARMYAQLEEAYLSTTEALAAAMEFGDPAPSERAAAIVEYADAVGRNLGLSDGELRDLRLGAILHDIGKVAVPDSILAKREPLSDSERRIVQQHATVSEQILSPVAFLAPVRPLVRHGHERWDGRGYPDGLRGEQIPLGARIILACDAYTAMTVERPYRRAMTHSEAIAELRRHAGRQFDLRVIDALVAVLDRERVQA